MPEPRGEFQVRTADGVLLAGEQAGEGVPVLLLHGLTATRRYVVMGSRALERSGHRVIAYDARGHGHSAPAPGAKDYGYELLADDLLAVLDRLGVERATLAGASMGAQTAIRLTLDRPERVGALALITPAFDPQRHTEADAEGLAGGEGLAGTEGQAGGDERAYADWDRLADGLRGGGVDGFIAAYDLDAVPERWRETVLTVLRQRLSAHEHPLAVADALETVPRSRPFERWDDLDAIAVPTLVVASRDEADPGHPLAIGERYAKEIPGARLVVEGPQESPIGWQGGRLSKLIAGLVAERGGE